MKKYQLTGLLLVSLLLTGVLTTTAQIRINVPKIGQPKATPSPASSPSTLNAPATQNPTNGTTGSAQPPTAGDNAQLLKTTLDIRCDTENHYWKLPTESNYTSWIPMLKFKVRYAGAAKLRLMAEYFTPDG